MVGIETEIDKLLDLVQEKKKITVSEAARKLKVSESKIESWGKVLSDENILDFTYPANPLNPPFLRAFSKEEVKKKDEKVKDEIPVEKPKKKKYHKRKIRRPKAISLKFFSRFRSKKKSKKKRNNLPYILVLISVIIVVMYFTGVIEWLISLLNL